MPGSHLPGLQLLLAPPSRCCSSSLTPFQFPFRMASCQGLCLWPCLAGASRVPSPISIHCGPPVNLLKISFWAQAVLASSFYDPSSFLMQCWRQTQILLPINHRGKDMDILLEPLRCWRAQVCAAKSNGAGCGHHRQHTCGQAAATPHHCCHPALPVHAPGLPAHPGYP